MHPCPPPTHTRYLSVDAVVHQRKLAVGGAQYQRARGLQLVQVNALVEVAVVQNRTCSRREHRIWVVCGIGTFTENTG